MKILHIIADMPFGGGLSESVPMLAESEQRQGMAVTLVSRTCALPPAAKRAQAAGVRIIGYRPTPPHFLYFSWGMLMGLGKEVRAADVVHIHSNWTFPVWWGGWLALRYKKTLVMSPRGCLDPVRLQHSAWKKRLVGWMDRWLLRRASVVHATCEGERAWIQAVLKLKKPRIVVIPNGVGE
jgi:glycosyltransferase involved in cell wall biosynthesis